MFEFYNVLLKGGWVMVPIGLCSVLALGLFLERMWTLRRSRVFSPSFVDRVRGLLRSGKRPEALVLCERDGSAMALILATSLIHAGKSRDRLKELMEERGRLEFGRLDRFVEGLGTIAAIAPLLGLLGTVLGMVDLFKVVEEQARGGTVGVNPALLAGGIWKALITTVAGLTVAIPTFVGYKFLNQKINRLVMDMEEAGMEFLDELSQPAPGPKPAEATAPATTAPVKPAPAPEAPAADGAKT
jgi:biopolymer transport protein ExbB